MVWARTVQAKADYNTFREFIHVYKVKRSAQQLLEAFMT